MDKLVLRDEKAGEDREADIKLEGERGVGDVKDKEETGQDRKSIEGMADALPLRESAFHMENKLIEADGHHLNEIGE